jgi:hypothetical protein
MRSPDTITTAAREYANRPKDERFLSPQALIDASQIDRQTSVERTYNLRDLQAVDVDGSVRLASPKGTAGFTHWSFGQFARLVGAPAAYLRELPADLAAQCINHGISDAPIGQSVQILAKANQGSPIVRSATSDSYGRVWDAELYGTIADRIINHDPRWRLPPTWTGEPAGAYRGDRDSFLILTNGGSIVTDPSLASRGRGELYRGLLVRNSEVGASAITIEQILYRYVCGNHMLWGAIVDRSFRRRHVGDRVLRDTIREISAIAYRWADQSAARDEAIIRGLISADIASTRAAVIDELMAMGATKDSSMAAYDACERTESASPRSYWGAAQGLTRISQDSGFQDERYALDKIAAAILAKGRKLVAA